MACIRVKNGPQKDKVYEIGDDSLIIGRDPVCQMQIMDKGASRQHAEVFSIGEMCFIRDLESRNGTYVNEDRITEEMLREGDRIQIGATIFIFEGVAGQSDVEFIDEEDTSSTLELQLEDLTDLTAQQGDGAEVHRLRALYRLGRMIGESMSEKRLIDKVLPFICEEMSGDICYLFTRNAETGAISPVGSYCSKNAEVGKVSRSIIRRAIVEKRAILTSDAMSDGRFKAQESIVIKGIRSVICVPLSVSGNINGVLYLSSSSPAVVFRDDELELAAAMADQVGLAMANFRNRLLLRENLMSTIRSLVRTVEMHDPTIAGRSARVSQYATVIGRKLGLSNEMQQNLQLAGLLHNIGIIAEGELAHFSQAAKETYSKTKSSPEQKRIDATLEIISGMECYQQIEKIIRYMYERNDGTGPQGMKEDQIPALARILGLAIDFDQMANKAGKEEDKEVMRETLAEVGRQAGRKYDQSAVQALLMAHRDGTLYGESGRVDDKKRDTGEGK